MITLTSSCPPQLSLLHLLHAAAPSSQASKQRLLQCDHSLRGLKAMQSPVYAGVPPAVFRSRHLLHCCSSRQSAANQPGEKRWLSLSIGVYSCQTLHQFSGKICSLPLLGHFYGVYLYPCAQSSTVITFMAIILSILGGWYCLYM